MSEEFAIERQQRMQNFQQNLKDAENDYREKRQQMRDAHRRELNDLNEKYNADRKQRRDALIRQLEDTQSALTQERLLRQRFTQAMLNDLARAIKSISGSSLPPARDSGGYMLPGIYRNASGSNEYVLSPQVTRTAEQLAGGRLTQASILRMMMSGGGGAVTYNDHRRIDGRILPEDRRMIRRDTIDTLQGLLR
jgi:predicted phage gp36 major capsid-like protein